MERAVLIVGSAVTLRLRVEATLTVRAKASHIQHGGGGHVEAAGGEAVLKGVEATSSVGFEWAPPALSNPSYPVTFGPWAPAAYWCVQEPGPQLLPRNSLEGHAPSLCAAATRGLAKSRAGGGREPHVAEKWLRWQRAWKQAG